MSTDKLIESLRERAKGSGHYDAGLMLDAAEALAAQAEQAQAAEPVAVKDSLTVQDVTALAHRIAWRYKMGDPVHPTTYTFTESTLLQFVEAVRSTPPAEWRPIEEAPEDALCVVAWVDPEDGETRHEFDMKEDGCWVRHHDHAEHVEMIGGHGVSYTAPYTHFMRLRPLPPQPVEKEPT